MADDKSLMEPDLELSDDIDEPFDPEPDGDLDADDVDEDPLEDDVDEADEVEKVEEVEEETPPNHPAKRADATDGEFDDEVDPDNLEDDLNTILRDRIAAGDDADDDDDGAGKADTGQPAEMLGTVTPRRDDEWLCEGCFLLVSRSQLGSRNNPRCPSGEEVCPSLGRLGP